MPALADVDHTEHRNTEAGSSRSRARYGEGRMSLVMPWLVRTRVD